MRPYITGTDYYEIPLENIVPFLAEIKALPYEYASNIVIRRILIEGKQLDNPEAIGFELILQHVFSWARKAEILNILLRHTVGDQQQEVQNTLDVGEHRNVVFDRIMLYPQITRK